MQTILIKLSGGIGNQIFQYLFGTSQFNNRDTNLLFDVSDCLLSNERGFSLTNLGIRGNFFSCNNNIFEIRGSQFIRISNSRWISTISTNAPNTIDGIYRFIKEQSIAYRPLNIEQRHDAYYYGYWQSSQYWDKNLAAINQLTDQLSNSKLSQKAAKYLEDLQITPEICAIHVRRGDYLSLKDYHGVCEEPYFIKAALNSKIRQFHLYTDDQAYAQFLIGQFNRLGLELVNASAKINYADIEFFCLTHYAHFIISNSSFSYLATFIAKTRHPILSIFAPYPWYSFQLAGPKYPESAIILNRFSGNTEKEDDLRVQAANISVLIPLHSRTEYLMSSVETALNQTHQPCEVILCLNDPTKELENEANRLASQFSLVRVVRTQTKSLSAARNVGILSAKGEYIAFLDDDDLWEKNKLEIQIKQLILYGADAVACNFYEFDSSGKHLSQSNYPTQQAKPWKEVLISDNLFSGGSGALVKKSVFDQVGYFDEAMPACEDHDMWRRIANHNFTLFFIEDILLGVRKSATSMSANKIVMLRGELMHFSKILQSPLNSEQFDNLANKIKNLQREINLIHVNQAKANSKTDSENSLINNDLTVLDYPAIATRSSWFQNILLMWSRLLLRIYHYEHLSTLIKIALIIMHFFTRILVRTVHFLARIVRYIFILFILIPIELCFYLRMKLLLLLRKKDAQEK